MAMIPDDRLNSRCAPEQIVVGKMDRALPLAGAAAGLLVLIAALLHARSDAVAALLLVREDGDLEWTQCLLLALACGASLAAAVTLRRSGQEFRRAIRFLVVIALGFAFVFAEEISWGQRLLGFTPPEALRAINRQGEFNLHNLAVVQPVRHYLHVFPVVALASACLLPAAPRGRSLGLLLPGRPMLAPCLCALAPYAMWFLAPGVLGPDSPDLPEYWRLRLLTEWGESLGYGAATIYAALVLLRARAARRACAP